MSMFAINNVSAQPVLGTNLPSVSVSWVYQNPPPTNMVQYIHVHYSDNDATDTSVTPTYVSIPIVDGNGNLSTSYVLTENIMEKIYYIVAVDVILNDNSVISSSNSGNFIISTPPATPNTFLLYQNVGGTFSIKHSLSNTQLLSPSPLSNYDGFTPLEATFITYNDGTTFNTVVFYNDNANSLYSRELTVTGLANKTYEVTIKNKNSAGMSQLSSPQLVEVQIPIPGPAQNFTVTPTMLVDPSFNPATRPVSNTLTWLPPIDEGNPRVNSYSIFRNNSLIHTIHRDASGVLLTSYVDNVGLVAGQLYNYTVNSLSQLTVGLVVPNYSSFSITALGLPTITSVNSTAGNASFSLDVLSNYNGFLPSEITFDVSGNNGIGYRSFSNNPFTVSSLSNAILYTYQVRLKATRSNLSFYSAFTSNYTITAYAPLPALTNFVVSNTDPSGVPLNNKLNLSWNFPSGSNVPAYQQVGLSAVIYRKLTSSPDASYNQIATISSPTSTLLDSGLTNGLSYTYKIVNSQLSQEAGNITIYSTPIFGTSTPFTYPSAPSNLTFTSGSMAYNFTRSSNNGGLDIVGYVLNLTNVNNGNIGSTVNINLTNKDGSGNIITSGNLLSSVSAGSNYRLTAQAYVNNNGQVFSSVSNQAFAYSTPDQLSAPIVYNVDGSGNPINGGNALLVTWSIPQSYDASNARFDLYRKSNPVPIVTNLSTTSYIDTGLNNGSMYDYRVSIRLGSLSANWSNTSNEISPFSYPSTGVRDLVYNVQDANSILLSWNPPTQASLLGTGINSNDIYYRITNATGSVLFDNLTSTSRTLNGFTPGVSYTYFVLVGVSYGTTKYYNDTTKQSVTFITYGALSAPTGLAIYPSSQSALVDVDNAPQISGLTFSSYAYRVYDNITSTWTNIQTQSGSLFYVRNLIDNRTYTVEVSHVYNQPNNVPVSSPVVTGAVTPRQAPNQPTLLPITNNNQGQLTISITAVNGVDSYSVYKDNEILYSHIPAIQGGSILQFNLAGNFWFFNDNVTAGVSHTYGIVAEYKINNTTYVSSQAATGTGIAWSIPGQVNELTYSPSSNSIALTWQAPTNSGGAGAGTNSNMKYIVNIYNPVNNFIATLTGQPQDATSATIAGSFTDSAGNNFTITNSIVYRVSVTPLFYINGNVNNQSRGPALTIQAQPKPMPQAPVVTATPLNTSDDGKLINLNIVVDPSANTNNVTILVNRVIKNSLGTTLASISNKLLPNLTFTGNTISFNDSPSSIIGNDIDNFLNGNVITYTIEARYFGWTVGSTYFSSNSSPTNVTPSGKAIIESMTQDNSGNINYILNKNGASVNTVLTMGFSSNNQVQVKQETNPNNFTFSNAQINGVVAQNQKSLFIVSGWNPAIQKALGVFSTSNSSALKDIPTNHFILS